MGFVNGIKSFFGFGQSQEELEEYDATTASYTAGYPEVADSHTSAIQPAHADSPVTEKISEAPDKSGDIIPLPETILDAVIERFNQFQPEFVRQCLSFETERKLLLADMAEKLKNVTFVSKDVPQQAAPEVSDRISELENLLAAREHTIREDKRYTDSLERQKNGLMDRITALEHAMRHHTVRVTREANNTDAEKEAADKDAEITRLKEELSALATKLSEAEQRQASEPDKALNEEIEKLKLELDRQTTLREQLEMKSRMSDTMLTDLRNAAAQARRDLEEATTAHQTELTSLRETHELTLAEIEKEQEAAVTEISEQISAFETVKAKLEAKVAELQAELKAEREKSERLADEAVSLRSTIETNLYNQANNEMRLRAEIKELQARIAPASAGSVLAADVEPQYSPASFVAASQSRVQEKEDAVPAAPKRKRGRPRKQAFEAELDNPSAFMSGPRKDDPEFGYHEPPHRPVNDSAAQLSLF